MIEGTVTGDVIAAAGSVRIPGRVRGDVQALARSLAVSGSVDGSVRGAAQTADLSGRVGRNVNLAANTVLLGSGARVGRDLHAAARTVTLDGGASLAADTARVGATVERTLRFDGRRPALAPGARVGGNLVARAQEQAVIPPGAVVAGAVRRLPARTAAAGRAVPRIAGSMLMALGLFITGAIGLALVPRFLRAAAESLRERPLVSVLLGLLILVAAPIIGALIAVTIIGIPVGLLILALWAFAVMLSAIPVALFLGRWVSARFIRGEGFSPYESLAFGMLLIGLPAAIPILRGFVLLAVVLFGVGIFILGAQRLATTGAQPAPA
ncbi:MAG: polymer-forming cytoskeletal protein [Armatimonadetes bacterium]|nr:polymer-forming cytoskeletal protein [Armatimonadota bacterium]